MQLKIQRSQRMGGALGGTVVFCMDVQAEYSGPEAENVRKYKLGKQIVYNSRAAKRHLERANDKIDGSTVGYLKSVASFAMARLSLNISFDSLARGQHIECKDLEELLEAEEAVMVACRTLKRYLQVAATFNGGIDLIDFDDGERLHVEQGSLELLDAPVGNLLEYTPSEANEYDAWLDRLENMPREEWVRYGSIVGLVLLLLFMLTQCV